jgi:hypothetical protein
MNLTLNQVAAMAPDSSSAAAGKKLMGLRHWAELGQSPEALWGQCQGSALYQVKVDCSNLGYQCSCPSRKFPCKHVLGLLMLYAESPGAVAASSPPEWVATWLGKRQATAEKKAAKLESAAAGKSPDEQAAEEKPTDEKAQARRAAQRDTRVRAGLEHLDLWTRDLVRNGLAGLETRTAAVWEEMAKRLVDANAPGLASRVRRLGEIPGSSRDWPRRLLAELGRLKLVTHAYGRLEKLDPALQSDIRQTIGWTVGQEELQSQSERVRDDWLIYGQWIDDEDRVRAEHSWMVGRQTGRTALVLQFAPGAAPFAEQIVAGTVQSGTLAFFPGAAQQRAKFLERSGGGEGLAGRLPGSPTIEHYLASVAEAMARQPLLPVFGCVLRDVTLVPGDAWHVRDGEGRGLPLAGKPPWKLLAVSGGGAIDLAGQWAGRRLRPLGMVYEGQYRAV